MKKKRTIDNRYRGSRDTQGTYNISHVFVSGIEMLSVARGGIKDLVGVSEQLSELQVGLEQHTQVV